MNMLAAHTDRRLRELADKGNKEAQAEMIRRGLAGDPAMEALRRKQRREYRLSWR